MANAVFYKWKWVGYSYRCIYPELISESINFYESEKACLGSAYMNVPFIDIVNPWTHVDLYLIKDNAHTGEIREIYMFSSYSEN